MPVKKSVKKTVKKSLKKPVKKTAKKSAKRPAKKSAGKRTKAISQKRLRDIAWEIGHKQHVPPGTDHIALLMINPHSAHVYWHITEKSLNTLRNKLGGIADQASLAIRIYDITDVIFDGFNAHSFFDLNIGAQSGNYYFRIDRAARNYLAEAGLRCMDGSFHYLARSGPVFFDNDRPSGNYLTAGLFSGGAINRTFPVENIFDAPVYEEMNRKLAGKKKKGPVSVAEIFLDVTGDEGTDNPLDSFIRNISGKCEMFGAEVQVFTARTGTGKGRSFKFQVDEINAASETVFSQLSSAHEKKPFHVIHCHDWYSSKAGITASAKLKLPMVLTLHSTEPERSGGNTSGGISSKICAMEKEAVQGASLVIVSHSSTRDTVISEYEVDPDRVVIIPHTYQEKAPDVHDDSSDIRRWFGLNRESPIVLFAGEISHAAGADIMVDALPTVCRNNRSAQFIFAGNGPLKGELEARAHHSGIGRRCRFPGDISSKNFQALLMASDFVVIPARTWQDEGLARMAIANGKPVLVTQQAGIKCVKHGENGLVTFDNPGSIVWGIQELLSNPLHGSMLRIVSRKKAKEYLSFETMAAQHYMYYEIVRGQKGGVKNA